MTDQSPSISRFRRRLTIEAPVGMSDGAGGADVAFASIGAAWAQVEWLRGDERWQADRFEQAGQIRITLRHRSDLTAAMRFRDGSRLFAIKALGDPDGAARRTVCACEEILP